MKSHLDQVIVGVRVDTARLLDEALVLDRVWLEEETFTGETRLLGASDQRLVLQNDLAQLFVGSILCLRTECEHLAFEATTLVE